MEELVEALCVATAAGEWGRVSELASELEARRAAEAKAAEMTVPEFLRDVALTVGGAAAGGAEDAALAALRLGSEAIDSGEVPEGGGL